MEKLEERTIKVISQQTRIEEASLTPDARFIEDLGIDSVDFIEVVMQLEKEFHIKMPDEQIKRLRSVGDVIENIKQTTREQNL